MIDPRDLGSGRVVPVPTCAIEHPMQPLIQPYLAGRLNPELRQRFEEALLESPELVEAVELHATIRDSLAGNDDAAPAPRGLLARLRSLWKGWRR